MTKHLLNVARGLPKGVTQNFGTPCQEHVFSSLIVKEVFKKDLPLYVKKLQAEFEKVPMGQFSGLAQKCKGNPFDECLIEGRWSAEQFAMHGGPIPCQGGAPGSRGLPEKWPYHCSGNTGFRNSGNAQTSSETDWANMNWATAQLDQNSEVISRNLGKRDVDNSVPAVAPVEAYGGFLSHTFSPETSTWSPKHWQSYLNWTWWHVTGSLRRNSDGSKREGGKKLNKNRTRGGAKRKQCNEDKPPRDKQMLNIYFGNTTYASEKLKRISLKETMTW